MSATDSRGRCRRAGRRRPSGSRPARRCRPRTTTWVRSVGLSKIIATVRGPSSGCRVVRRRLERGGQVEHLGLLGRAEVVVARGSAGSWSVAPGHAAVSRIAGPGAARNASASVASVSTSGGASRTRRASAVDDEPGLAPRRRRPRRTRLGVSSSAEQQALAAHLGDPRVVAREPVAQPLADLGDVLEQAVGARSCPAPPAPAAHATGLPPNVVPWLPGRAASAAVAEGDARADRDAAAEALGER